MSNEGLSSPGSSSKRFACDRCRGQKLRCVRECASHETCKRCFRVGAVCVTSPPLRMGRPSRAGSGGRRRSTNLVEGRAPTATVASTGDNHISAVETGTRARNELSWLPDLSQRRAPRPFCTTHDRSNSNSNNSLPSPAFSQFHDWHAPASESMASIPDPLEMAAPADSTESGSSCLCDHSMPSLNWPWESPDAPDEYVDPTNERSSREDVFSATSSSEAPAVSHPPNPSMNAPSVAVPHHIGDRDGDHLPDGGEVTDDFAMSDAEQDRNVAEGEKTYGKSCTQQLSELNLNLHQQSLHLNSSPGPLPLSALTCTDISGRSGDTNYLGNILHSSQEFLKFLISFFPSSPSDSLPASALSITDYLEHRPGDWQRQHRTLHHQGSRKTPSSDSESSFAGSSGFDISGTVSSVSLQSRPPTENTLACASSLVRLDTPVILLVLSCYVHIIRIYSMIFSHIHSALLATRSGLAPSLPTLPGLQLSGFPLQSGNLQVKILMEVVVHSLDRIEQTLGLPLEYRVSRGDGRSKDMLGDPQVMELFKIVIRQEERAGVKSIREYIRSIKHLLKDILDL